MSHCVLFREFIQGFILDMAVPAVSHNGNSRIEIRIEGSNCPDPRSKNQDSALRLESWILDLGSGLKLNPAIEAGVWHTFCMCTLCLCVCGCVC